MVLKKSQYEVLLLLPIVLLLLLSFVLLLPLSVVLLLLWPRCDNLVILTSRRHSSGLRRLFTVIRRKSSSISVLYKNYKQMLLSHHDAVKAVNGWNPDWNIFRDVPLIFNLIKAIVAADIFERWATMIKIVGNWHEHLKGLKANQDTCFIPANS